MRKLFTRWCRAVLVWAAWAMVLATPAMAEKRVALVIGNSSYVHVPRLDNPANDARLMAQTLRGLGFTVVGDGAQLDLDKAKLDAAVQTFGQALQGADVALFYYAGHGVQVRGNNYLVPVGANPTKEADVDFQMLDTALVLRQMEGARTRLNLVLLDACRNNPLASRGLRSADAGLAQMRAPEGTLISYATQPGNVAQDGEGGNSPYTKALTQAITRPGLDIFQTFNEVGLAVMQATGSAQQPWLSTSPIRGSFYFAGAGSAVPVLAPPPPRTDTAIRIPDRPSQPLAPPAPPRETSPAPPRDTAMRAYRVQSNVSQGILNMRTGPAARAQLVVAIPAGATLRIGACRPPEDNSRFPWCEAEWQGHRGFVSRCCIDEITAAAAAPPAPARGTYQVLPNVSDGILNMRRGPGTNHPVVASIPAGATGLAVGRCRSPEDGSQFLWCEVEWQGRRGWASSCCMIDARTGAFARGD